MRAWVVVAVAGCFHERPMAELDGRVGERVRVETTDGAKLEATVEDSADGPALYGATGYIDRAKVARVVEVRRGRGALEGLITGALVGGVGGAVVGYAIGDDALIGREGVALSLGVMAGVGLGALGTLAGVVIGSEYVYSYDTGRPRIQASGPSGALAGVTIAF
jgi:hypothetical protein